MSLYKVLGAKYGYHKSGEYICMEGGNYIKGLVTGINIFLEDKYKFIYLLHMWEQYYREVKGINAHGFQSPFEWEWSDIFNCTYHYFGLYTIEPWYESLPQDLQLQVKDKSNGNDLVWINNGCDIKNHLFTCIKYGGDSYYSQGSIGLNHEEWDNVI